MDAPIEQTQKQQDLEGANQMFQKVWKRVMNGTELCPIVLEEKETAKAPEKRVLPQGVPSCALPVLMAEEHAQMHCKDDFPPRSAVPFLGSASAQMQELLQELIRRERYSAHFYRALGRRVGGTAARVFSGMVADNQKSAKRLCAVCFLISGVQFMPEVPPQISFPSYLGSLRERFIEEQQNAALYVAAATESQDPWLYRLFSDLAEEKMRHAKKLCLLVEQH